MKNKLRLSLITMVFLLVTNSVYARGDVPVLFDGQFVAARALIVGERAYICLADAAYILAALKGWDLAHDEDRIIISNGDEFVVDITDQAIRLGGSSLDLPLLAIDGQTKIPLYYLAQFLDVVIGVYRDSILILSADNTLDGAEIRRRARSAAPPAPIPLAHLIERSAFTPLEPLAFTDQIQQAQDATLTLLGQPNTAYYARVRFRTGYSVAAGLGLQTADDQGRVSWTWRIGSRTTPGAYPIMIYHYESGIRLFEGWFEVQLMD